MDLVERTGGPQGSQANDTAGIILGVRCCALKATYSRLHLASWKRDEEQDEIVVELADQVDSVDVGG